MGKVVMSVSFRLRKEIKKKKIKILRRHVHNNNKLQTVKFCIPLNFDFLYIIIIIIIKLARIISLWKIMRERKIGPQQLNNC